jgi:hypothetical protein
MEFDQVRTLLYCINYKIWSSNIEIDKHKANEGVCQYNSIESLLWY